MDQERAEGLEYRPSSVPGQLPRGRLLLVRMSPDATRFEDELRELGGDRVLTANPGEAFADGLLERVDLVVVDALQATARAGLQAAAALVVEMPRDSVVLVLPGAPPAEVALEGLRLGLRDLIVPQEGDGQAAALLEELDVHRASRCPRARASALDEVGQRMLGESPEFTAARQRLARAAESEVSVLLLGETGTGKEIAVRALHEGSRRGKGPFVAINCMALPEALLESELFGHAKGSFSDAHATRAGLFRRAHGGTLFLDEIGEMPMALQGKLLRALEEQTVRPVGSDEEYPVDVRLVSATRVPLEEAVQAGHFREDLYYRLDVLRIALPPLRDRGLDVLILARHFLHQACEASRRELEGLSAGAARCLLRYPWPGNIRELRNAIEQGVALCAGPYLDARDLPEAVRRQATRHLHEHADRSAPDQLETLEEMERCHLARALEVTCGNKAEAARRLGIDRSTLYRKLKRFQIKVA